MSGTTTIQPSRDAITDIARYWHGRQVKGTAGAAQGEQLAGQSVPGFLLPAFEVQSSVIKGAAERRSYGRRLSVPGMAAAVR
ncbi:hypothetical protein [Rhizobium leguminosarum]|uniref:hypothetical protein n=1 Tax=Rhizobium leguminosarum TaxID=384 RepID=UPI003F4F6CBA